MIFMKFWSRTEPVDSLRNKDDTKGAEKGVTIGKPGPLKTLGKMFAIADGFHRAWNFSLCV